MGLNFQTLLNSALLGTAAYQGGERQGQDDYEKKQATQAALMRQAELDAENKALRDAQIGNYNSEAANRKWDNEHPKPPTLQVHEQHKKRVDELVAQGMPLAAADKQARMEYGEAPQSFGYGTPERVAATKDVITYRDNEAARTRRPLVGRGAQGGTVSDTRSRDAYVAKRTRELIKGQYTSGSGYSGGMDADKAASAAQNEWATIKGSGTFADVATGHGGTAGALATTIPKVPGTPSSNAGRRGPKEPVSTSTPKVNPMNANSPKVGTKTDDSKLSDADLWEQYKRSGMTADAATAKVRARSR